MGSKKVIEALDILEQFNVPNKQQNERSALALLALLSLKEKDPWKKAKKALIRVHDIMQFIKKHYNKEYAENSRETFRRQTLHQFEKEVGIVERNADEPTRPTNSPNTTWSVTNDLLKIVKTYGTAKWKKELPKFLKKIKTSVADYKVNRSKHKLSIILNDIELRFSLGKHNELQIEVLNNFKKYFCPDAKVLYVGDTAHKMLFLNTSLLREIKLEIKKHDILPDIVLLDRKKDRLYLIEAVSSHGPVSNKRMIELNEYFKKLKFKKIFVSAFPSFKEFKKHVDDIAWETEVWISEIPNHMIHFNGDKFLKLD
ncbi:MAG: BsuBI/PstI family type II restriction endonuclease [Nanoarchaeota archaeon]|nr:BsuBI/PstI family type II restriction endonuclease [Nanoarchaeota archaeon]